MAGGGQLARATSQPAAASSADQRRGSAATRIVAVRRRIATCDRTGRGTEDGTFPPRAAGTGADRRRTVRRGSPVGLDPCPRWMDQNPSAATDDVSGDVPRWYGDVSVRNPCSAIHHRGHRGRGCARIRCHVRRCAAVVHRTAAATATRETPNRWHRPRVRRVHMVVATLSIEGLRRLCRFRRTAFGLVIGSGVWLRRVWRSRMPL